MPADTDPAKVVTLAIFIVVAVLLFLSIRKR